MNMFGHASQRGSFPCCDQVLATSLDTVLCGHDDSTLHLGQIRQQKDLYLAIENILTPRRRYEPSTRPPRLATRHAANLHAAMLEPATPVTVVVRYTPYPALSLARPQGPLNSRSVILRHRDLRRHHVVIPGPRYRCRTRPPACLQLSDMFLTRTQCSFTLCACAPDSGCTSGPEQRGAEQ